MNDFEYHRPATIADATRAIAATADGRYLGGGMSLLPAMKLGLSAPSDLVDLSRVDGLRGACVDAGRLHVGAGTTHAAVAASDVVRGAIPWPNLSASRMTASTSGSAFPGPAMSL